MTPEESLMGQIHEKYGAEIERAVAGSPFPPALLAALTANEEGLDPNRSRLEPGVYVDLSLVLVGRLAEYDGIGAADLGVYLGDVIAPKSAMLALLNLATSWGPTQIMGWQSLKRGFKLAELLNPETHYPRTVQILADFAKEFKLTAAPGMPPPNWDAFFRCWNSGKPNGRTFDPNYSGNGVRRLQIYESLVSA
jgi:hypothetical protein